jgi:hypothetical protein
MDALAGLADTRGDVVETLLTTCRANAPALNDLWRSLARGKADASATLANSASTKEQFLILVECVDEAEQVRLLQRFYAEGISCRALVS